MKTINAPVQQNGYLTFFITRGRQYNRVVKRQSRRQLRHQLQSELRKQRDQHLQDAIEERRWLTKMDKRGPRPEIVAITKTTAKIYLFPARPAAEPTREITVIKKSHPNRFARTVVEITRIAA